MTTRTIFFVSPDLMIMNHFLNLHLADYLYFIIIHFAKIPL